MPGVLSRHWHDVLAVDTGLNVLPSEHCLDTLLDVLGLTLLEYQHLLFTGTELHQFIGNQWIGNVETIDRDICVTINIRQTLPLQSANDRVVRASAGDDAHRVVTTRENFIQRMLLHKADRRG